MKIKYKKIYGVDKKVCTGEQKIAYNYAFMWYINAYNDKTKQLNVSKEKIERLVYESIIREKLDKKYNIDLILDAFKNGFEKYLENKNKIYTNYESVGKCFNLSYEIE